MKKIFLSAVFFLLPIMLFSQTERKDKGVFVESKPGFYDEILKEIKAFSEKPKPKKPAFRMDFSNYDLPKSKDEFKSYWHNDPISQGQSGMCWCYSTTSMLESEVYRIYGKKVKISELHTVYWEYVEKARRFIRERGDSYFAEGSEANAVKRIWLQYGCVPAEVYTGLKPGQVHHDHSKMFTQMDSYLKHIKEANYWDEEPILNNIKAILNYHIGEPPKKFKYEGKEYAPSEFLKNYIKLNMDDYVDILSYMQKPYYEKVEYEVPDNWWHDESYINVPLDEFMKIFKEGIKKGYTVIIGGDVSEPGYDSWAEVAMIPTFDIPSEYIDEYARQFRFSNKTTQDDHGIHVVGYMEKNGEDWFLIKDSGSGSRNGANKGYYFYHEDYVKLKMMDYMIHKDCVGDLLGQIK